MNKEALFIVGKLNGLGFLLATKAVYFAVEKHDGQKRDDQKTDYVDHPVRVCRTLLNIGIRDEIILTAALLHDLIEEGKVTFEEISKEFNEEVSHLVGALSKREGESKEDYMKRLSVDIRAIIIKAVDRVCNVDDMIDVFPTERLEKYTKETKIIVLPLMKVARRKHVKYSDLLIICRDYIKGILRAAEKIIDLQKENARLKKRLTKKKKR